MSEISVLEVRVAVKKGRGISSRKCSPVGPIVPCPVMLDMTNWAATAVVHKPHRAIEC